MKNIVILGAGTGGTLMANKLRKKLSEKSWDITIVDQEKVHYYQPGFLFIPFGIYKDSDVIKPKEKFIPKGVKLLFAKIDRIVPQENKVLLENNKVLSYDFLIIATGTRIAPEETPGLLGKLWQKEIFDFYTLEGASALAKYLETWKGGKMVVNITELPYKCPVAPLEFIFLADAFFKKRGMRDKVDITLVTPLPGVFTKPIATKMLGKMMDSKNINIIPDYNISEVDNDRKKIVDYGGTEVDFDLLVTIPTNKGDDMIERSALGDDLNFVLTDKFTLQAVGHQNIFVIGDAANLPTSKAGSVAHFASEVLEENILCAIEGKPLDAKFDGHANCYIVTSFNKGTLIDFNYDTEPLPGLYPYPVIGPFALLKDTRLNYFGKMFFRWMYWNLLLKARKLPVTDHMSMAGKKYPKHNTV
ncbi:MAG: FAD/NAD(P)-binding oxidoreductase [Bacteroidales bacterium]|nr:FAD/NAD(P)-binding oxidoreductase [Bacteroidales bacterium]MDD3911426.1 FAD/NAD(P)-binding oxidoreductase [Bacteroidales bacterium]MDD4491393.1 FAD/NAD(P)-binding oxidoreductase [Bacteroidales bacterium]